MQSPLTAGAYRVLVVAERLAAATPDGIVSWGELVWALLLLETRAAEILAQHGVSPHNWGEDSAPAPTATEDVAYGQRLAIESHAEVLSSWSRTPMVQNSPLLQQTLQHAADFVRDAAGAGENRSGEIRSEHILWGLLVTEPTVAALWQPAGLTRERLAELLGVTPPTSAAELDVDFSLRVRENQSVEHQATYRVLDAAANRAREGLRVLEDYVRFLLDDAHLNGVLKRWRHRFSQTCQELSATALLAARDTVQDVGTQVKTLTEQHRESLTAVLQANCKRVGEALRTLEEFGKILNPEWASEIERLRYEFYTIEKAVLLTQSARQRLDGRHLYLLVTEEMCHHGSGPVVRGGLAGGVGIVQLREKSLADRELLARAQRVREWTHAAGGIFIMNDRPDLALLSGADGVHVGQEELTVRDARRILGPDRLVGVSTHSIEQARQAVLDGADYIGVGPVFPSRTKSFEEFPGLELVRQVAAEITLPWYPIGGIHAENLDQVLAAGATRVAVSSAICQSPLPERAARQIAEKIQGI